MGGSNYKNNIWTRGFAIVFVFAAAVFKTQNRSVGENSEFCYVFRVFDPPTRAPYQIKIYLLKVENVMLMIPKSYISRQFDTISR